MDEKLSYLVLAKVTVNLAAGNLAGPSLVEGILKDRIQGKFIDLNEKVEVTYLIVEVDPESIVIEGA